MADGAGIDIDDRLKIKLKMVLLQSMAYTLFPMNFFLHVYYAAAFLKDAKGIASLLLGIIHGRVRLGEQFTDGIAVLWKLDNANTGIKRGAPAFMNKFFA